MQFERIADKKRVDFILKNISSSVAAGSLVLDYGCGNGIISKAVAEQGFRVIAVDVSEKAISIARTSNPHPLITYFTIDDLPPNGLNTPYEAIICSEVLEHLERPEKLIQQLYKQLSPHGVMLVTVPNGRGPRELLVTRPVQYLQTRQGLISKLFFSLKHSLGYTGVTVQSSADDLTHRQFFTPASLKKLARQNGFQIKECKKTNFIEQVFPFSFFARRSLTLQRMDCAIAEKLPLSFTSGFMMVWVKAIS